MFKNIITVGYIPVVDPSEIGYHFSCEGRTEAEPDRPWYTDNVLQLHAGLDFYL
jgi:hypothetical protein